MAVRIRLIKRGVMQGTQGRKKIERVIKKIKVELEVLLTEK